MISEQVYQPEADTYLLLAAVRDEIRGNERILEVGTGSGEIAFALQEMVSCTVIATDINPYAVKAARRRGIEVIRTDMCRGICSQFDIIICNPPYLPTQPEERIDDWLEYALDGGPDGLLFIRRFLAGISCNLAGDGKILLLISSLCGVKTCEELFTDTGFSFVMVAGEMIEGGESLFVYRLQPVIQSEK
ncbi:MAG: methyltransferase [Methanospirillaceae archaeon]|nr:methyltransferase [Methanospirillaceae archaeon]